MFSEEDQRLLPDFCRALGYVLSPEAEASQLVERHGSLFSDILSGTLSDAAAIEARARRAQLDLPKSMIVLVVQQTSHVVQVPLTFLRDQILRQFPDGLVHMWAGNHPRERPEGSATCWKPLRNASEADTAWTIENHQSRRKLAEGGDF